MSVYKVNPLNNPRWSEFLERQSDASIYHTPEWLESLKRTYNYDPVVYTTSRPNTELENGIVFCQIKSWLTGKRMVSLPFSDHCQPLVDNQSNLLELLWTLDQEIKQAKWKYIELRPLKVNQELIEAETSFGKSKSFHFHLSDLRPDLDDMFKRFDRKAVRYGINRSEREGLEYQEGISDSLLTSFYSLLILTRKKHRIPPQPLQWFKNLKNYLGDKVCICTVSNKGIPITTLITLRYKSTYYYKYIGSNQQYKNLGGTQLLYWNGIKKAKSEACTEVDWGRSDWDNASLVTFKNRWDAQQSTLTYYSNPVTHNVYDTGLKMKISKQIFSHLPRPILSAAGRFLYKHIG